MRIRNRCPMCVRSVEYRKVLPLENWPPGRIAWLVATRPRKCARCVWARDGLRRWVRGIRSHRPPLSVECAPPGNPSNVAKPLRGIIRVVAGPCPFQGTFLASALGWGTSVAPLPPRSALLFFGRNVMSPPPTRPAWRIRWGASEECHPRVLRYCSWLLDHAVREPLRKRWLWCRLTVFSRIAPPIRSSNSFRGPKFARWAAP